MGAKSNRFQRLRIISVLPPLSSFFPPIALSLFLPSSLSFHLSFFLSFHLSFFLSFLVVTYTFSFTSTNMPPSKKSAVAQTAVVAAKAVTSAAAASTAATTAVASKAATATVRATTAASAATASTTTVYWFRKSLRLHDNPSLMRALNDAHSATAHASSTSTLWPVFLLDPHFVKNARVGLRRWVFLYERKVRG